ncbi:MAG TPA: hypothetical protein VID72_12810 [Ktedonobacterales bacterium]
MAEPSTEPSETSDEQQQPDETAEHVEQPDIDIEALAEKVYRLMLAEIRLDRARGLASDDGG